MLSSHKPLPLSPNPFSSALAQVPLNENLVIGASRRTLLQIECQSQENEEENEFSQCLAGPKGPDQPEW